MLPDWAYDAMEAVQQAMDPMPSPLEWLAVAVFAVAGDRLMTLLHELGHAAAATMRGRRVTEVVVRDSDPRWIVRLGRIRLELGGVMDEGRAAG